MSEVREMRQMCETLQRIMIYNEINMCGEFIMSVNNNNENAAH